ncbi:uncharacterized protein LOC125269583 [Megalobrama amblycephala]|uniref:uncharacterized protein LOC125269583 n=1 Tax=Megalobrama amblycephala TaxID=75352 RepID=UPI002013E75A|nr:uncharacterized protein LOC125269583 [Megalobrama amblycephala]XP_048048471.1 uncharacterized protein LOC125269583 [Megalobrama amblycephala]
MNIIIPKSKTKSTDICGAGKYYYIIRSDLGCYMKIGSVNRGSDISVFSLHPACKNGDHYLGGEDGSFYIIKGNSYRRVTNLTTDSSAKVYSLHPNCQGGDHYFSASDKFFIIFQERGTFRITTDMNTDLDAEEYKLHPNCKNGLYYWGLSNDCFFLKPVSEWGVEYYKCTDLGEDECIGVYSVHPDVLNFLPGGLTVTIGPSFGNWENIKATNDSNTPATWQKKINKKIGYNKEQMSQITHNWKIATSALIESGEHAKLILKLHLFFFGDFHVSTKKESCNEMIEVEEQLIFELKPNESVYLWQ